MMYRHAVAFFCLLSSSVFAQSAPTSDPLAISFAQKSIAALTGKVNVADVTLNATVISTVGADSQTGTGTFQAKGTVQNLVALTLSEGTRSEVRYMANGQPAGAWQKNGGPPTAYSQHNCWTDASWFFPALSSLTQTANPKFVFKYIGLTHHAGATVQHIRVFRVASVDSMGVMQRLSTIDFYLDPNSNLPLAAAFKTHADKNMNTEIPSEVRFADYKSVDEVQVPYHVQQIFNGTLALDITVTHVVFNTGLADSLFKLQ